MAAFSSEHDLNRIKTIISRYIRLPFSQLTIPGAILESVLAHVHNAEVLNTYDFVDVIKRDCGLGWQVKSTKATTPVTWKRAKIPQAEQLIRASRKSTKGLRELGRAIIEFCNAHARQSIDRYDLNEIGYARLVIFPDGRVMYFERRLCTKSSPNIFDPSDFEWRWSNPKQTKKKVQLQALHGFHLKSSEKWWAWHGLGENQLHFSGEKNWWPATSDSHCIMFNLPSETEKMSLEDLLQLLERSNSLS